MICGNFKLVFCICTCYKFIVNYKFNLMIFHIACIVVFLFNVSGNKNKWIDTAWNNADTATAELLHTIQFVIYSSYVTSSKTTKNQVEVRTFGFKSAYTFRHHFTENRSDGIQMKPPHTSCHFTTKERKKRI